VHVSDHDFFAYHLRNRGRYDESGVQGRNCFRLVRDLVDGGGPFLWDVSADGKRFLIDTGQPEAAEEPITVVTN
jgi:hypothetical protein